MLNLDKKYKKSPFVQVIQEGDVAVIWHSLFGYPKIVSSATLSFLNNFLTHRTVRSQIGGELPEGDKKSIEELLCCYFLVPDDFNDRALLEERMQIREAEIVGGSLIDYLGLIMSEACNFRCTYCIHFNNLEKSDRIGGSERLMRFGTAKKIIDWYLRVLRRHGKHVAEVNFGGGEPLLAWPAVLQTLSYCRSFYGSEFEFFFSINTNASLITPEIATVLKEYRVDIASSLDGFLEGNDRVRLTKSGEGTFLQVVKGFDVLTRTGYPLQGFAMTITENNFCELNESIIDWAVTKKMKDVRIDIDVIHMVDIPVEDVVAKLMHLRNYANKQGIAVPGFWSRPAENLNASILEDRVAFCGAVRGNSVCVSPVGDIYSCGYSTAKLGTLAQVESLCAAGSEYYLFVKNHLIGKMEMCKGCMIEGQCGGGCNITQEFTQASHSVKTKRMCDFYRRMTKEILIEQLRKAMV